MCTVGARGSQTANSCSARVNKRKYVKENAKRKRRCDGSAALGAIAASFAGTTTPVQYYFIRRCDREARRPFHLSHLAFASFLRLIGKVQKFYYLLLCGVVGAAPTDNTKSTRLTESTETLIAKQILRTAYASFGCLISHLLA